MATQQQILTVFIAILAAALVAFVLTPLVKHYSVRFGFVDIPKDNRRMHHKPIPTIGGLAIYAAFVLVAPSPWVVPTFPWGCFPSPSP